MVELESESEYDEIQLIFERFSPTSETITTSTDLMGNYFVSIASGIYNISILKDGWKPVYLYSQYLVEDIDLGTIVMEIGYAEHLSGDISGHWTSVNDYYIEDDIHIPEGEALFIDPGVRIMFNGKYDLTVSGNIYAEGTADARISFTSNQPVPEPGDWGMIELESESNIFRYVDYEYANNGFKGHDGSGSIFQNCTIREIPVYPEDGDDHRWHCHGIEFEEGCSDCIIDNNIIESPLYHGIEIEGYSSNLTITNNVIDIHGKGIDLASSDNSVISNNTITISEDGQYAIEANYCDGCIFEGNNLQALNGSGIQSNYSDSTIVINNNIIAISYGVRLASGNNLYIADNEISNTSNMAISFDYSESTIIENNIILLNSEYAIVNWDWSDYNNSIINNYIEYSADQAQVWVIPVHNTLIQGNYIKADYPNSSSGSEWIISGSGNTIIENEIYYYNHIIPPLKGLCHPPHMYHTHQIQDYHYMFHYNRK